jgi:hypothetical protein
VSNVPSRSFELYAALATVAAITAALQASATFTPITQVERLEERHSDASPGTQAMTDVRADAKKAEKAAMWLTLPAALVNGVVLVAWGAVALDRSTLDWVLVAPWAAVTAVSLFLAAITVNVVVRIRRIHAA